MEYDITMKYGLLLIILIGAIAQAQVYKTVDKYGNTVFTDIEDDNSEEVIIDIAPSYTAPDIPVLSIPEQESIENTILIAPMYQVNIDSPAQNESFSNPETISVSMTVSPVLNAIRADKILFKLDGKALGPASTSTTTVLTGIERGSHILVASVVDKSGEVIKSSKSVLFHVQRFSIAR